MTWASLVPRQTCRAGRSGAGSLIFANQISIVNHRNCFVYYVHYETPVALPDDWHLDSLNFLCTNLRRHVCCFGSPILNAIHPLLIFFILILHIFSTIALTQLWPITVCCQLACFIPSFKWTCKLKWNCFSWAFSLKLVAFPGALTSSYHGTYHLLEFIWKCRLGHACRKNIVKDKNVL